MFAFVFFVRYFSWLCFISSLPAFQRYQNELPPSFPITLSPPISLPHKHTHIHTHTHRHTHTHTQMWFCWRPWGSCCPKKDEKIENKNFLSYLFLFCFTSRLIYKWVFLLFIIFTFLHVFLILLQSFWNFSFPFSFLLFKFEQFSLLVQQLGCINYTWHQWTSTCHRYHRSFYLIFFCFVKFESRWKNEWSWSWLTREKLTSHKSIRRRIYGR
jgi:sensor histidine kinase YesM